MLMTRNKIMPAVGLLCLGLLICGSKNHAGEVPETGFETMYEDVAAYVMDPANNPELERGVVSPEYGDAKVYGPAWIYFRHDHPGFSATEKLVASKDGSQLYRFSAEGYHDSTINALTGATVYTFGRDSEGRLTSVTDGDSNTTTIQRDASGRPTAVTGPYGQTTTLTLDGND